MMASCWPPWSGVAKKMKIEWDCWCCARKLGLRLDGVSSRRPGQFQSVCMVGSVQHPIRKAVWLAKINTIHTKINAYQFNKL